jgi:hypothetical protein
VALVFFRWFSGTYSGTGFLLSTDRKDLRKLHSGTSVSVTSLFFLLQTDLRDRVNTKLICTIGPSSCSTELLTGLIHAGMTAIRFDFTIGDRVTYDEAVKNLATAVRATGKMVAVSFYSEIGLCPCCSVMIEREFHGRLDMLNLCFRAPSVQITHIL